MRGETNSTSRTGGADFQVDAVIVSGTNSKESIRVAGEAFAASVLGPAAQVNITRARPGLDRLTVNALAGDDVQTGSPGLRRGTTPGFGFDPCFRFRVSIRASTPASTEGFSCRALFRASDTCTR